MAIFICERNFGGPISDADFAAAGKVLQPCLDERDVTWLSSNLSTDGTRSMCFYEAADAERVREANRVAGAPFDRVWEVRVYRP